MGLTDSRETAALGERALVVCPFDKGSGDGRGANGASDRHDERSGSGGPVRSPEAKLEEAVGLAAAIDLVVAGAESVRVNRPVARTYFGSGVVSRIGGQVSDLGVGLVIVDNPLTPVQQRNLERAWDAKVLDRTGLILEIFGERARTKEGQLQVELASLVYQRSRLVRSWTHLERQRGGVGFMGGPGESQLEIDRRIITDRIAKLRRQLSEVQRTRELHRSARKRVPYPVVALVGYTNAGKSTLFNRLARSEVMAEDLLFATLDPTMRAVDLGGGHMVILSDTVGFISDLPTQLIAAFRATLEEVTEADLIIHVRDIAHPDTEAQRNDVRDVLSDMGLSPDAADDGPDGQDGERAPVLEVLNKIDLLDADDRQALENQCRRDPSVIAVSAVSGQGLDRLIQTMADRLGRDRVTLDIALDHADGQAMSWLHRHGQVEQQTTDDTAVHLRVRLSQADAERFRKHHTPRTISQ